jgi:hypothetical protein
MAPDIRRFEIAGATKDTGHLLRKQGKEEEKLRKRMYRSNCVPVLDIVPILETSYDSEKEVFHYSITMYGIQVDENIEEYEGWLSGKFVRSTLSTKLERLSNPLE